MNAGKAVYGILSANSGVTDIVGTRIFPEIAEQEAVTPFVIYQLQSVAPEDTHDGPSKLDEVRFEFLCYADSYNEAADLGVAVRGALDRVSGTYNGVNVESVQFNDVDVEIEYDPRRYSQVLKFTFRIKRDDIEIALGTPVTGAELGDLSDVNTTSLAEGNILKYDESENEWVNASLPILTTGSLNQSEASGYTILSIDSNPSFDSVQSSGDVTISGDILLVGASTKLIRPFDAGFATGPLTIQSNGDLIIELDEDDNEPYKALIIKNGGNTEVFKVDEGGSVTVNQEYVLPTTDGGTDYFLKTDGNGQLYFATLYGTSGNTGAAPPPAIDTISELLDTQISSLADDQILRYDSASGKWLNEDLTLAQSIDDLTDVDTTTVAPTTGQALVWSGSVWSPADVAVDVQYHDRYASEAETLLDGATETVELYYTAQADGDGLHEDAQSDTASENVIRRKLYYAEKAQADPDTSGNWTQFADIADDTAYATAKATLLAYLKERTGGTVPISLKMTWEDVPAATRLLDTYTGAAAAYSLRLLSDLYSGDAVEVYNGTSYADIGFADGELDTVALAAHCGSNDGFISKFYDQAGSNDLAQTTVIYMPKIYDGTTGVETDANGKPQLVCTNDNMIGGPSYGSSNVSIFAVARMDNNSVILGGEGDNSAFIIAQSGQNTDGLGKFGGETLFVDNVEDTLKTRDSIYDIMNPAGMHLMSAFATSSPSANLKIGYNPNGTLGMSGELQEVILYTSDQSSDRTDIEDNINTFYDIYS